MARTQSANSGISPRLVTTGLKSYEPQLNQQVAHIDWLSFTITPPDDIDQPLGWYWPQLRDLFNIPFMQQTHRVGKWQGYDKVFDLHGFGLLGHGGAAQRGTIHVSLNAAGCARIADWQAVQTWAELNNIKITRVDLAHDDFEGHTVNIETIQRWYDERGFETGGCPPASHVAGDWLTPGSPKGRTIYIGTKASGKQLCAYEKGKASGQADNPWFRVEGRLGGKKRIIPHDVLTNPGHYLAGMYPCLAYLSNIQHKIKTITQVVSTTLDHHIAWLRSTGGKVVNVLFQQYGGDAAAVVEALILPGIPRRLVNYADFLHLAEMPQPS